MFVRCQAARWPDRQGAAQTLLAASRLSWSGAAHAARKQASSGCSTQPGSAVPTRAGASKQASRKAGRLADSVCCGGCLQLFTSTKQQGGPRSGVPCRAEARAPSSSGGRRSGRPGTPPACRQPMPLWSGSPAPCAAPATRWTAGLHGGGHERPAVTVLCGPRPCGTEHQPSSTKLGRGGTHSGQAPGDHARHWVTLLG